MLTTAFLLFSLLSQANQDAPREQLVKAVSDSGRCETVAERPGDRVAPPPALPPGLPPLLSFRYYEAKAHNHAGNSQIMLDDAGH